MKKIITTLLLLLYLLPAFAQIQDKDNATVNTGIPENTTTSTAGDSVQDEESNSTSESNDHKLKAEIKKLTALLEAAKNGEVIATLKLKDSIKIYNESSDQILATKQVDSVFLIAQNGFITDVIVYIGIEQFTNSVIISLTKRRHYHNEDMLRNIDGDKYVYYQDLVDFQAIKGYVADDTHFTFRTHGEKQTLHNFTKGSDLKTALDLRVYTDALGLFANNPNGLVQIDAASKFLIHQSNITGRSAFILHYLKANVNFAKFDSKQLYVTENDYSRSALLQRSWFNASLALNLFEGYMKQHYTTLFYIDAGGMINASSLAKNNKDTVVITSTNIWGQGGISIKGHDNYGFTASATVLFNYSPQTADIDFARNAPHVFFKPCVEAFYNPFGDETNRIFTKVSFWMDTWNINTQQNHFWQFQIGYNTTLSKLSKQS